MIFRLIDEVQKREQVLRLRSHINPHERKDSLVEKAWRLAVARNPKELRRKEKQENAQ